MRVIEHFDTDIIAKADGRRPVDAKSVDALADSILAVGLRTPITVRIVDGWKDDDGLVVDGQPVLVTGAHRLEAVRKLGWKKVECFVFDDDDESAAEMWEIDENLCRHELTATETAEHLARRKAIWEARELAGTTCPTQPETDSRGQKKSSQQSEGFATETAKATGKSKKDVNRSVKRGNDVCQEARDLIRNTKLDTGSTLDKLAKLEPDEQVAYIQETLDAIKDKERRDALKAERQERDRESKRLREEARDEVCSFLCNLMSGKDWAYFIDVVERSGGSVRAESLRRWQSP